MTNNNLSKQISPPLESEVFQETYIKSQVSTGNPPAGGTKGFYDPILAYGGLPILGIIAVTALIKALTKLVKASKK